MSEVLDQDRNHLAKKLQREGTISGICAFLFSIFAILLMLGAVACVIALNFSKEVQLLSILIAAFLGGSVIFAGAGVLLSLVNRRANERLRDVLEQADSAQSFFVGEETLATFGADGIRFHNEEVEISVPYGELRFFSVCLRSRPVSRGKFLVAIEVPLRYLKETDERDAKVLVEADMKDRLIETLKAHGLELTGELPDPAARAKRYSPLKKFRLPDAVKRRHALPILVVGAVAVAVSVPIMIFGPIPAGVLAAALGAFLLARGTLALIVARAPLYLYAEGIYGERADDHSRIFLRWEEIERLWPAENILSVQCAYTVYSLMLPAGAWEYLEKFAPKKCAQEDDFAQISQE